MPCAMGEGGQLIGLFPDLSAVVVCAADGPSDMGRFLSRQPPKVPPPKTPAAETSVSR